MASKDDLLMEVGDPGTATTLAAPGYTVSDTSINVGSTTNWPTATGVTFAIDEAEVVDGQEVQVAGTYNEYVATVSTGTSLTNVEWVRGVGDRDYAAGALTRVYIPVSAERENRIVEWGTTEHNQDGTHDNTKVAMLAGTQTFTGTKTFSTTPVVPDGSWTPAKMALTKTTDANGWTKYDYGTFQQYRKKGSTSTTVTAGNWKYHTLSSNLPVGMASIGTNFVEAAVTVSDAACSATLGAGSSETSIQVALSNQFSGGSITPTISWSICITTA